MKLHLYLFKEGITSIQDCLKDQFKKFEKIGDRFLMKKNTKEKNLELMCYQYIAPLKQPIWHNEVDEIFEIDSDATKSRSNGVLIFHQSKILNRIFCISYGKAHSVLEKNNLEPNFGLKFSANLIQPKGLNGIDFQTFAMNPSYTKKSFDRLIDAHQLDLDIFYDSIKMLSGVPTENDLTETVNGADYLNLHPKFKLKFFKSKCAEIYDIFSSKKYQDFFPFLDYMVLEKNKEIIEVLNNKLISAIENLSGILLVSPYYIDYVNIYKIFIYKSKASKEEIFTLCSDEIFEYYKKHIKKRNLDSFKKIKIKIEYKDDEESDIKSLYKFLYFETSHENQQFIFYSGSWIKVQKNYLDDLREKIKKYDKSFDFDFPVWDEKELKNKMDCFKKKENKRVYQEEIYNKEVAEIKKWYNFDRINFLINDFPEFGTSNSKFEFCDLIDPVEKNLIFVKHFNSSSGISHLATQVTMTAYIYNTYKNNLAKLIQILEEKYKKKINLSSSKEFNFVICIAAKEDGKLESILPVLALISLSCIIDRFRRSGLEDKLVIVKIFTK